MHTQTRSFLSFSHPLSHSPSIDNLEIPYRAEEGEDCGGKSEVTRNERRGQWAVCGTTLDDVTRTVHQGKLSKEAAPLRERGRRREREGKIQGLILRVKSAKKVKKEMSFSSSLSIREGRYGERKREKKIEKH